MVQGAVGEGAMNKATALRRLLAELRRMPNATPAEALAEFRRLVASEK